MHYFIYYQTPIATPNRIHFIGILSDSKHKELKSVGSTTVGIKDVVFVFDDDLFINEKSKHFMIYENFYQEINKDDYIEYFI